MHDTNFEKLFIHVHVYQQFKYAIPLSNKKDIQTITNIQQLMVVHSSSFLHVSLVLCSRISSTIQYQNYKSDHL